MPEHGDGTDGTDPDGTHARRRLRAGREDEALSALALRSKAHWGYDRAFLAR